MVECKKYHISVSGGLKKGMLMRGRFMEVQAHAEDRCMFTHQMMNSRGRHAHEVGVLKRHHM